MKTNNKNVIWVTKSYLGRKFKDPIYIILNIIFAFIYPPFLIIGLGLAVFFKTQPLTVFELNSDFFTIQHPYRIFGNKEKQHNWEEIEEIRIKKFGDGGYGNIPYLDVHLKNGNRKRQAFDTLDKEDFEGFTQAIKSKLGGDKLFVNEL